jgi:hypothetical protein
VVRALATAVTGSAVGAVASMPSSPMVFAHVVLPITGYADFSPARTGASDHN